MGAAVAAEDFKKLLSRHGLNLIAERVEDEKTVVQLLDYSVDYAQGFLFGEPRAVRDDALKPDESISASAAVLPMPLRRAVSFRLQASLAEQPHGRENRPSNFLAPGSPACPPAAALRAPVAGDDSGVWLTAVLLHAIGMRPCPIPA